MDLAQLEEALNEIRDIQSMIDYSADLEGTKCLVVEGVVGGIWELRQTPD